MAGMKTEQISRGFMAVGVTEAVVSHVRLTIGDAAPYDEVAYRLGKAPWEVVASHLTAAEAGAVFDALSVAALENEAVVGTLVAQALDGA